MLLLSSERAFSCLALPRSIGRFWFTRELAVYVIFGGTAALVNLETGWLLYGPATGRFPYWLATGIAAAAGLITNFGLNYLYNFKFRDRSALGQFITFAIVSGFGVVLTAGLATAFRAALYHFVGSELDLHLLVIRTDFAAPPSVPRPLFLSRSQDDLVQCRVARSAAATDHPDGELIWVIQTSPLSVSAQGLPD